MGEQPPCIAEDVGSIPAGYVAYGQNKTIVSHKGKIKNSLFIELIVQAYVDSGRWRATYASFQLTGFGPSFLFG